ncbi:ABC transporter permease subunit [Bacillus mangrovi]|uniref:ABC transporter permease subunit n=2 Tax=Metabacillus mangrovi TaxID=1491830 RepID=A0A7X2S6B8_9BACI|nr:ABC transporter permease subunit [Metabacillus mangrovi]
MLSVSVLILLLTVIFYLLRRNRGSGSFLEGVPYRKKGSMPILILYLGLVFLPIAALAAASVLKQGGSSLLQAEWTWRAWQVLFEDPLLVQSIQTSAGIGISVVLLNFFIGIPAARQLAFKSFKGKVLIETVLLAPILIPSLLIAMGLHITLIRLGLANEWSGVILIQLLPTLPYTIKMLRSGYERMGQSFELQAETLGASGWHIFRSIHVPLLLSSLRASAFLVFVISLGQYALTSLIGGGTVLTLALVYFPYFEQADTAVMAAFSFLFALIPLGAWLLFELLFRLTAVYKGR